MNIHGIVPVKALGQAKSRLAAVLTPAERRRLVLEMFELVLDALRRSCVNAVWVVSADAEVLAMAAARRLNPVVEQGAGLNAALEQARQAARAAGAEALVVVPADVPLLTPGDLAALQALLQGGADVALAPDGAGRGTNALALRAGAPLPFSFGEGSAERHLRLAAEQGLIARRYHSPTLALDVDDQLSLARYRAIALPPPTCSLAEA
jgi:2-phospho-L-lactate guanylyltransferase